MLGATYQLSIVDGDRDGFFDPNNPVDQLIDQKTGLTLTSSQAIQFFQDHYQLDISQGFYLSADGLVSSQNVKQAFSGMGYVRTQAPTATRPNAPGIGWLAGLGLVATGLAFYLWSKSEEDAEPLEEIYLPVGDQLLRYDFVIYASDGDAEGVAEAEEPGVGEAEEGVPEGESDDLEVPLELLEQAFRNAWGDLNLPEVVRIGTALAETNEEAGEVGRAQLIREHVEKMRLAQVTEMLRYMEAFRKEHSDITREEFADNDTLFLKAVAEFYEKEGMHQVAAEFYRQLAETYRDAQMPQNAITAYMKAAELYERVGMDFQAAETLERMMWYKIRVRPERYDQRELAWPSIFFIATIAGKIAYLYMRSLSPERARSFIDDALMVMRGSGYFTEADGLERDFQGSQEAWKRTYREWITDLEN